MNHFRETQSDFVYQCYRLIKDFWGKAPRGIVAPWWESSQEGTELLLKYGVEYDHSLSHHDCQAYWLRTGDTWVPIDYEKHPDHWMHPLKAGPTTGLVEIPASWYLDVSSFDGLFSDLEIQCRASMLTHMRNRICHR